MDLVREDAQKLSRKLARHDQLFRQVANQRRELAPLTEALTARRRREEAALVQVEADLRELRREGIINKVVRTTKEVLQGGPTEEEQLKKRRLDVVASINRLAAEQLQMLKRYRELVDREELLLSEVYGEKPLLPRLAPWVFGVGAALAALMYGVEAYQAFWLSLSVAATGAGLFLYNGARLRPERIQEHEDELWRRIRVRNDSYREKLLEELDNVGVLLKEFREPAVETFARQTRDDLGYYRSLGTLLLEMARKDDHIAPEELRVIQEIFESELALASDALEDVRRHLKSEAARSGAVELDEHLARFRDAENARLLVRFLYRVAYSDSRFFGREQAFVTLVSRKLDVAPDQVELLRQEERTLAETRGLKLPPEAEATPAAPAPIPADIAFLDEDADTARPGRRRERSR
ncbi:MAG: TerB family tellurite resistance protein [Candidatus Wallbacteria bacterium]|nr:TerB family tellurite resistance protein [Candidatus Wallbacteria bacterium]